MDLKTYWKSLNRQQRSSYADSCATTVAYIEKHLIPPKSGPRKIPRSQKLILMADSTNGLVTRREVVEHFYPEMFEVPQ